MLKSSFKDRKHILSESKRICSKLAKVIDGEESLYTLFASLTLAVHCANAAKVSKEDSILIFKSLLEISEKK